MRRQNVRVILASEHPQVRYFLKEVIEEDPGTVVVGQAENAAKALTLARNLRPDFAVIDSYLPHTIGVDSIPLSRAGGLDTALAISEEVQNAQVVLVTNMDVAISSEDRLGPGLAVSFSKKELAASIPFKLRELYHGDTILPHPHALVFANVEVKPQPTLEKKGTSTSDAAIFLGGIGLLVGLVLTATMFLAGVGAFLALAGGVTVFLGVAWKLISSLWSGTPL